MANLERSDGVWVALTNPAFRSLWLGSVALNITIWMHSVAAAWLMVSLTTSPLMVALIQTASALPSFIFALPSGVMADLVDRRRYLLVIVGFMVVTAAVLCVFSFAGGMGAWMLLLLTFCLGVGFALQGPAWYTAQTDVVSRQQLPSALALSAVSYSSARAVGPALSGVVVSSAGVGAVFVTSAALLLAALYSLLRWDSPKRSSHLPPENLVSGMRSALRYTRHSEVVKVQILRTVSFVGVASALWALLPLIAGEQLKSGAGGYGILLASIGAGSVAGALLIPKLKDVMEMNRMMALSTFVYGSATIVAAYVPNLVVVCIVLFLSGIGWIGVGNTNMLALQSAVPGWVRARTLSVYMLVFQGAMAAGSALWGAVAAKAGTSHTLLASGLLMAGVLLVMNKFPARIGEEAEATESADVLHAEFVAESVPSDAPVAVQIVYKVSAENRTEFLRQLYVVGNARRRNGASFWRVYRDTEDQQSYVERFLIDSWNQYLRQRSRATIADQEAERRLHTMHLAAEPPVISHYVAEPCPQTPKPCDVQKIRV